MTLLGRVVNNYEIQALIGEGGQGSVYLAQHPFIGRKAAVKVMRRSFAEDDAMVARFLNEALAANAIGHPNIIDIIDVGRLPRGEVEAEGDGLPYLMMEHLEGETLGARLRRVGRLSLAEALPLLEQTTAALGAAHEKGIVHRDLKPENLFLARDAAGERLKVLDFGIAKLLRQNSPNKVETDGSLFGTPTYMSPEQCRGMAGDADSRSDVYALGAIAFEMLSGRPPFVADAYGDILVMHVTQPPPPLRSLAPEVPEAVASAVERALAKQPGDRFQSMAELWAALRWAAPWIAPVLPAALHAPRPAPTTIIQRMRRLPRVQVLLPAAALVLAAGVLLLLGLRRAPPAPSSVALPAATHGPVIVPTSAAAPPNASDHAGEPQPAEPARKSARPARRLIVIPEKPPLPAETTATTTEKTGPAPAPGGIKKW